MKNMDSISLFMLKDMLSGLLNSVNSLSFPDELPKVTDAVENHMYILPDGSIYLFDKTTSTFFPIGKPIVDKIDSTMTNSDSVPTVSAIMNYIDQLSPYRRVKTIDDLPNEPTDAEKNKLFIIEDIDTLCYFKEDTNSYSSVGDNSSITKILCDIEE